MTKLKTLLISIPLALALCLAAVFTGFYSDCDTLRQNTIRLHLLANSDSQADQDVKYLVRDALVARFGELFAAAQSLEQAKTLAEENLTAFKELADAVLIKNALPYRAAAVIVETWFDTTDYCEYILPAGVYPAIRVILGDGGGKNWFCVAFPPLCVYAATETDEAVIKQAAAENGWKVTRKKGCYIVKFKVYEKLKKWLEENF